MSENQTLLQPIPTEGGRFMPHFLFILSLYRALFHFVRLYATPNMTKAKAEYHLCHARGVKIDVKVGEKSLGGTKTLNKEINIIERKSMISAPAFIRSRRSGPDSSLSFSETPSGKMRFCNIVKNGSCLRDNLMIRNAGMSKPIICRMMPITHAMIKIHTLTTTESPARSYT